MGHGRAKGSCALTRVVARHGVGARGDLVVEVAVHVERDGDGRVRRQLADALQQLAFAILVRLHSHRSVEAEEDRVGLVRGHAVADGVADVLEGVVVDGARGRRARRDGRDDVGARLLRELEESSDAAPRAAEALGDGRASERHGAGARQAAGETRQVRRHRRVGVRLVAHLRDEEERLLLRSRHCARLHFLWLPPRHSARLRVQRAEHAAEAPARPPLAVESLAQAHGERGAPTEPERV